MNLARTCLFFRRWLTTSPFVIVLANEPSFSQNVSFEHFSLEDGLSQSTVEAIIQDRRGVMWFGTNDGLNRYDGYQFVVFRNDPADINSLSDNYIHSLCLDDSGFIWIGTNNGLNKLDPVLQTFTQYLHDPADPRSISHSLVMSVCADTRGNIWAGTLGGGLNLYDGPNETFIRFKHDSLSEESLSDNMISRLAAAENGDLWIGTFYGWVNRIHRSVLSSIHSTADLHKLHPAIPFERYFLLPGEATRNREDFVWAIDDDADEQVWIGTHRDGLIHFDARSQSITRYRKESHPDLLGSNSVQSLLKDDDGSLWIGTEANGLTRFHPSASITKHYRHNPDNPRSLSDNSVWSLYHDRNVALWIGTDFGGVNLLDPHRFVFDHYPTRKGQLDDNQIWAFHEDSSGLIWIGTDGGGLTAFDPETQLFTTFRHDPGNSRTLSNDFVMSISAGNGGVLWIGTAGGGLNRFDARTGTFTRLQHDADSTQSPAAHNIRAVFPSSAGHCWVGTFGSGLFLFDPTHGSFTSPLPNAGDLDYQTPSFVNCLLEDSSGALWIGTLGEGLFRYDHTAGTLNRFSNDRSDTSSIANDKINTLCIDRNNRLWVGTFGGLCAFEPTTGRFSRYTKKDGLPNDVIYGILPDEDDHLWLSTNKGISRFDPLAKSFMNFGPKDGLQSYEFNRGAALRTRDGRMFLGGVNGFNVFRPSHIVVDELPPPVIITSFKIMDREQNLSLLVSSRGRLELGPEAADFSFEFAALDYTSAEKNRYAYRLEGMNEEWVHIGNRRFTSFSGLPAGDYTFRVKGSNSDGVWNEEGAAVHFTILPPFWEAWWFRLSAATILVAVIVVVYRLRIRAFEREKLAQQETSRKLIKSQELDRRRIAGGLHDSLGQNLLILKNSIEQTAKDTRLPTTVRADLKELADLAQESLGEVREISFDLHPHVLDRLGLNRAIETMVEKLSRISPVIITTELCNSQGLFRPEKEINLYRVVQEALSNIVKHSGATSAVVRMTSEEGRLCLEIGDNGNGFDAEMYATRSPHERSLGLTDIAERVRLLGGTHQFASAPGQGTVLTVTIPHEKGWPS